VSNIVIGAIELYEIVLAWANPTQPNPWVNPTHVHVWIAKLYTIVIGCSHRSVTQSCSNTIYCCFIGVGLHLPVFCSYLTSFCFLTLERCDLRVHGQIRFSTFVRRWEFFCHIKFMITSEKPIYTACQSIYMRIDLWPIDFLTVSPHRKHPLTFAGENIL